ncbi:MAG: type II toxin-antitoxin system HicB family antitoxin [bacterium]|nr:type II toxin-antitoxin system HicB family antitoxin [bacterium]
MDPTPLSETTVALQVELLPEGYYLVTSTDVPGLVAQGQTLSQAVETAQGLIRKLAESCLEHGDPLPPALQALADTSQPIQLRVPVSLP